MARVGAGAEELAAGRHRRITPMPWNPARDAPGRDPVETRPRHGRLHDAARQTTLAPALRASTHLSPHTSRRLNLQRNPKPTLDVNSVYAFIHPVYNLIIVTRMPPPLLAHTITAGRRPGRSSHPIIPMSTSSKKTERSKLANTAPMLIYTRIKTTKSNPPLPPFSSKKLSRPRQQAQYPPCLLDLPAPISILLISSIRAQSSVPPPPAATSAPLILGTGTLGGGAGAPLAPPPGEWFSLG